MVSLAKCILRRNDFTDRLCTWFASVSTKREREGGENPFFFERIVRELRAYSRVRSWKRGQCNFPFRPREKEFIAIYLFQNFFLSSTRFTRARVRREGGHQLPLVIAHSENPSRACASLNWNNGCPRALYLQFISSIVRLGMPNSSLPNGFLPITLKTYFSLSKAFRNRRLREPNNALPIVNKRYSLFLNAYVTNNLIDRVVLFLFYLILSNNHG